MASSSRPSAPPAGAPLLLFVPVGAGQGHSSPMPAARCGPPGQTGARRAAAAAANHSRRRRRQPLSPPPSPTALAAAAMHSAAAQGYARSGAGSGGEKPEPSSPAAAAGVAVVVAAAAVAASAGVAAPSLLPDESRPDPRHLPDRSAIVSRGSTSRMYIDFSSTVFVYIFPGVVCCKNL